jgi:hypothetical protein
MATKTIFTSVSADTNINVYEKVTSERALLGDTVELTAPIPEGLSHVFIGVKMYDSGGSQLNADAAGTFTVTVQTANTGVYEAPPSNVIDATAPTTVSVAGNLSKIRVVPASLSTTVDYEVIITANGS